MMRGCTLRAGQRVFLHIGAANRDPSVYASPEVFDPDRAGPAPLSFGWGQNQCIGRSLALSSAVIFLMVLAERGQRIEVDGTRAEWSSGLAGRGFCRVPGRLLGESRDMRNERHT